MCKDSLSVTPFTAVNVFIGRTCNGHDIILYIIFICLLHATTIFVVSYIFMRHVYCITDV